MPKIITLAFLILALLPLMGEESGDSKNKSEPTPLLQEISLKDGRKIEGLYDKDKNEIILVSQKNGKAVGKISVNADDIVSIKNIVSPNGNIPNPHNADKIQLSESLITIANGSNYLFTYPTSSNIESKCDPKIGSYIRLRSGKGKMSLQLTSLAEPETSKITDQASLNKLVESVGTVQYEPISVEKKTVIQPLKIANGIGAIASYTDAGLVGKTVNKTQYKCVSMGCIKIDKTFITATLLYDALDSQEYREGLSMLEGLKIPDKAFTALIIPGESWLVQYSGPVPSHTKGSNSENGYEYQSSSEEGMTISMFVESPKGPAENNEAVGNFYWKKATQNPVIDPNSVKKSNEKDFFRIEYTALVKNVNYYFIKNGKWIDLHVSFLCEENKQEDYLKKFESDLKIRDNDK